MTSHILDFSTYLLLWGCLAAFDVGLNAILKFASFERTANEHEEYSVHTYVVSNNQWTWGSQFVSGGLIVMAGRFVVEVWKWKSNQRRTKYSHVITLSGKLFCVWNLIRWLYHASFLAWQEDTSLIRRRQGATFLMSVHPTMDVIPPTKDATRLPI